MDVSISDSMVFEGYKGLGSLRPTFQCHAFYLAYQNIRQTLSAESF